MAHIRTLNSWIGKLLVLLFAVHGLAAGYMLAELTYISWVKSVGYAACGLLVLHGLIAIVLSLDAWRAGRAGKWYWRENTIFWLRRLTGLALLIFLFFHFGAYGGMVGGRYQLREFTTVLYLAQLGLLLSCILHVGVSVKGMLIADGITKYGMWRNISFLILAALLVLMAAAVTMYYAAWNF